MRGYRDYRFNWHNGCPKGRGHKFRWREDSLVCDGCGEVETESPPANTTLPAGEHPPLLGSNPPRRHRNG